MPQESAIVHLHGREFRLLQRCRLLFLLHRHPRIGNEREAGWLINVEKLRHDVEGCLERWRAEKPVPRLYNLVQSHAEKLLNEWDNLFQLTTPFESSLKGIIDSAEAMEKAVCHPSLAQELEKYL